MSNFKHMNAIQLGTALGRTRQTIRRWTIAGMPRNRDKSYSLPHVIEWLLTCKKTVRNAPKADRTTITGIDAIRRVAGVSEATVLKWLAFVDCPIQRDPANGAMTVGKAALIAWLALLADRDRLQTRPAPPLEGRIW